MKNVVIIGGGIIGMSTAYYLLKEGHKVTVVDQYDISFGASFVNAGYITPSHIIPLAAPGMINKGIKFMLDSKSPFYMKPRWDMDFIKWSWNFKKSATKSKVEKAIPVIAEINVISRELYKDMHDNSEIDFSFDHNGLLMLYQTAKAGAEEAEVAEKAKAEGLKSRQLDINELKSIEPEVDLDVKGAILYECDAHMTPNEFMDKIHSYLRDKGVAFHTNEKVTDFDIDSEGKVKKVITDKKTLSADEVVVASGAWSQLVTKKLGIGIPIQAGKGYRINLHRKTGIKMPAILMEAKVAVTPMKGFTRFAGTMEIGGINHDINKGRVAAIADAAQRFYPKIDITQQEKNEAACGLRPCSPDGLPYIGKSSKCKNVTIATGHAMMGWSLGPATGKLVSEIISEKKLSMRIDAFHPDRTF